MKAYEFITEALTPATIHKLADRTGVKWDNEPSFLRLTKRLTGKEHLDDLNQTELQKVKQYLEKQAVTEGLDQSLSSMAGQDQAERNAYKAWVKAQPGAIMSAEMGAKYAQLKNRSKDDVFGDAVRQDKFMKMKFNFDKFTDKDWKDYWAMAQHCDKNRDFQKNALSIIKKYQGEDHIDRHYQYLYDRISCGTTGKQKYGTQDICGKDKPGVAEGFPQPGESSGRAKQFNPNAKVQTKEMTLDQLLATVKGIPYVNNVVDDWDAKDYSWGVTKKVIEYAQYLQKNPQSVANLPPLVVIDGQLNDGAHRLSAINLLQKRMDPKNPLWKQVKLKVNFGTSADVASEQGVAEAVAPDQQLQSSVLYHGTPTTAGYQGIANQGLP